MRLIADNGTKIVTATVKNNLIRLLLLTILVTGIALVISNRDQIDVTSIQSWVAEAGSAAPILFMLIYAAATVFFFPGSILTLLGGALFGPVLGVFYNLTAATIGSILAFLISRYLASDWVENKTGGKLKQIINGVENEGWRFVAFVRLVPLFPFNLLNYALGLTKIKLSQYSVATFVFMLPAAIAYTYLGYIGKEAATGGEGLVQKAMLALALLGIVAFLPRIISSMRKAATISATDLKQRLDTGEDFLLLDVRTEQDYNGEQGHIKGSTLLPLEQLEQRIDEITAYLEKPVVIICRTDRKSLKAAQILSQNNFNDVSVAKMGMTDWIKKQYPVAKV